MKKTQACRHQRVEFARWADVAIIGSFLSGLRHHYLSTIAGTSLVSTVWLVGVARFYLLLGLAVRGWYKSCTRSVWPNPERCQWTAVLSAGCHKLWLNLRLLWDPPPKSGERCRDHKTADTIYGTPTLGDVATIRRLHFEVLYISPQ